MYLEQLGIIAIAIGFLVLISQIIGTGCYINKKNKEKYRFISLKPINTRTYDEDKFIKDNWFKYYITIVRNISFLIGLLLIVGSLLFTYITK